MQMSCTPAHPGTHLCPPVETCAVMRVKRRCWRHWSALHITTGEAPMTSLTTPIKFLGALSRSVQSRLSQKVICFWRFISKQLTHYTIYGNVTTRHNTWSLNEPIVSVNPILPPLVYLSVDSASVDSSGAGSQALFTSLITSQDNIYKISIIGPYAFW